MFIYAMFFKMVESLLLLYFALLQKLMIKAKEPTDQLFEEDD